MRRGDLVLSQVISTALMAVLGAALGLLLANALINSARGFLAEQTQFGGEKIDYASSLDMIFVPVGQFFWPLMGASLVLSVAAAIYPAIRAARTDPAKVLQS